MDVVVTVPKDRWADWLAEGDLPGEAWSGRHYLFTLGGYFIPKIDPGERVYIVAHGRLRGYAPLVHVIPTEDLLKLKEPGFLAPGDPPLRKWGLVRAGQAVAVTIDRPIPGFRAWRYRHWPREIERPFPEWRTP